LGTAFPGKIAQKPDNKTKSLIFTQSFKPLWDTKLKNNLNLKL